MATPSDFHPSQLEVSMSVGNAFTALKPALVRGSYNSGAPSTSTIKPSLVTTAGDLKPSLIKGGLLKRSIARALQPTLTVDASGTTVDTTNTLADKF